MNGATVEFASWRLYANITNKKKTKKGKKTKKEKTSADEVGKSQICCVEPFKMRDTTTQFSAMSP